MADLAAATRQPRRYLLVGLACAAIHNAVTIGTAQLGASYLLALVASFLILLPTGYALHSLYTFERDMAWARFVRFAGGLVAGFPVNLALMALLCSGLALPVAIATPIATLLLFAFNFIAARWAIHRHL